MRSAFAMTEPAPGGGSDPGMIRTRAERQGDRWIIRGHKWFITGAGVADHFILMARTSDDARKGRRPSFIGAALPDRAEALVGQFVAALRGLGVAVATGRFGAQMEVEIHNDGPVTIWLDTDVLRKG